MQHLQPNTTLQGGKYKIERVLGQGGFGITYVAINTEFEETVAIKEFYLSGINERDSDSTAVSVSNGQNLDFFKEQKAKFKKEARRMRQFNNPHIVRVHDLFEENGTVYYVMEYIDGENLSKRMEKKGQPLTEQQVRVILPQILDALQTIHAANIWHLDLKPSNIMLDKRGNVKLIDFGASKQLNPQKGGATTGTRISYTPGFAPREQMEQNYSKFGPWTDIYALGATVFNLLTNKRPPMPTDIDDDMSENKHVALPMFGISEKMKDLVLQMMNTNWMERPQSVQSVKLSSSSGNQMREAQTIHKEVFSTITYETEKTNIVDNAQTFEIEPQTYLVKPSRENKNETTDRDESKNNTRILVVLLIIFFVIFGLLIGIGKIKDIVTENNTESETDISMIASSSQEEVINTIISNMVYVNYPKGDFYICKYEVTQGEWDIIMFNKGNTSLRAKESVTWEDSQVFIKKLNKISGRSFRLPLLDEWVFAANGGNKSKRITKYAGSDIIDEVAWIDNDSHDVGLKKPNELGLYDMTGNVAEWCEGGTKENHYIKGGLNSYTNDTFSNESEPLIGYSGDTPTPDGAWHLGLRLVMDK